MNDNAMIVAVIAVCMAAWVAVTYIKHRWPKPEKSSKA